MEVEDPSAYLRLSQFLDLESQWSGARSSAEICHRICRTAGLLLNTPAVAIGLLENDSGYRIVAADGAWVGAKDGDPMGTAMFRTARTSATPQIKSAGDGSVGVFPFAINGSARGGLHVRIERPLFRGVEISFLRFLASLAGIVLSGGKTLSVLPTVDPETRSEEDVESATRRYIAMAVHDLRNPLNVVAGYAGLLEEGSLGGLGDEQREAVAAIQRQVTVLLSVVDQLIDLDRAPGRGAEVIPSRFDVRELLEELRSACFTHANGRVAWPGPETTFEVVTDRRRVFSIVQNLIDNALKHTTEGELVIECTRRDKHLVMEFCDRGPGLDADLRAGLIAHTTTGVEPAPRAGLGLYSVATHIHALRGTLLVEDRDGGGTRILVRIPQLDEKR